MGKTAMEIAFEKAALKSKEKNSGVAGFMKELMNQKPELDTSRDSDQQKKK